MAGEEKEMDLRRLAADLKLLSDEELEQRFSQKQEILQQCTQFSLKTFREKPKGEHDEWTAKFGEATARRKRASDELQLVRTERTNRERSRKEQSERSKRSRNEEVPEAHGPAELANPERAAQSASPGSALVRAPPPPPAPAVSGPAVSAVSALAAPNAAIFGLPGASATAGAAVAAIAAASTAAAAPAETADGSVPKPAAPAADAPVAPGGNGLPEAGAEQFVLTTGEEAAEYVGKYDRRRRESAQRLKEKYLSEYFESQVTLGDVVVKESRQDPVMAFLTVSSEDEEDQAPDDSTWRGVERKKKHTGSRSR